MERGIKRIANIFIHTGSGIKIAIIALVIIGVSLPIALVASNQQQNLQQEAAGSPWQLQVTPGIISPSNGCTTSLTQQYQCSLTLAILSGNATPNQIQWTVVQTGQLPQIRMTPVSGVLHLGSPQTVMITVPQSACQPNPSQSVPSETFLFTSTTTDNHTPNQQASVRFTCASGSTTQPEPLHISPAAFNPGNCTRNTPGFYDCHPTLQNTDTKSLSWKETTIGSFTGVNVQPTNGVLPGNNQEDITLLVPIGDCPPTPPGSTLPVPGPEIFTFQAQGVTSGEQPARAVFTCGTTVPLSPSPTCPAGTDCTPGIPTPTPLCPPGTLCQPNASSLTCDQCAQQYPAGSLCLDKTAKRSFCTNSAPNTSTNTNTVCVSCASTTLPSPTPVVCGLPQSPQCPTGYECKLNTTPDTGGICVLKCPPGADCNPAQPSCPPGILCQPNITPTCPVGALCNPPITPPPGCHFTTNAVCPSGFACLGGINGGSQMLICPNGVPLPSIATGHVNTPSISPSQNQSASSPSFIQTMLKYVQDFWNKLFS